MFDERYTWYGTENDQQDVLSGFTNSKIGFSMKQQKWILEVLSNPEVYATFNASEFPMGDAVWDVFGDPCLGGREHAIMSLHLSVCTDDEFNCNDGSCISIAERCDGQIQCQDKSDELGCRLIKQEPSYLKDMPAPPLRNDPKAIVHFSMNILSLLKISEVESILTLQYILYLEWRDARLNFENLKADSHQNTLDQESKSRIWIPELEFYNTENKDSTINDEKAYITIKREGTFTLNRPQELKNTQIYSGKDNPMTISRVYSTDFICTFDMVWYPFDTQECSAIFVLKGNSDNFVKLTANVLKYNGPTDLTQYFVKSSEIFNNITDNVAEGIEVRVHLGRRLLSMFMTTYLPTLLICMVSFSTNHFQSYYFEASVTVNLTSLLVLTTLFISISDSLPKTAYIKMIDVWLIVCLFIPFSEVILHTLLDNLGKKDKGSRMINRHGTLVMEPATTSSPKIKINNTITKTWLGPQNAEEVKFQRDIDLMKLCTFFANRGLPALFILFTLIYFAVGMLYKTVH